MGNQYPSDPAEQPERVVKIRIRMHQLADNVNVLVAGAEG